MSVREGEYAENVDNSLLQAVKHDPRKYMQVFWRHPQRPEDRYDFKDANGENKLNYLLHDDGPLNPESWGSINILKIHRGGLKTTSVTGIASWAHHMYLDKGMSTYMTAPREKPPIKGFIRNFKSKVDQSGLDRFYDTDNQGEQIFKVKREDENGGTFGVKSVLEADSGYDPDTLRGPHSHLGIIDEFQDIGKPAFDTYAHCIDQEFPDVDYFPAIWIIGTPKETGSFYDQLWRQSDQKSWDAETNSWVAQSDAGEYKPSEEVLDQMDVDEEELEPRTVRGWHLDCYNSPVRDASSIAQAKQNQTTRKFKNEMEAVFHDPADNLLSEDVLEEHFFDDELDFANERQFDQSTVVLSVDWGGGTDEKAADTVMMVAEWMEVTDEETGDTSTEAMIHEVNIVDTSLTPHEEIRQVEQYIHQYDVDRGVVDFGHGDKKYIDLQDGHDTMLDDGYLDIIKACRFGNKKSKKDLKWDSKTGKRRFFTCNKNYMYEKAVEAAKNGVFTCPSSSLNFDGQSTDGRKLMMQLTEPNKELTTSIDGKKKTRIVKGDNSNDDAADALVFNWIGYHKVQGIEIPSLAGTNSRPGH